MDTLFISGIFMSFFIVLLLLTKKNKALTDNILATWVSIIGIHLLGYYLFMQGYWQKYPHLIGTTIPFPLLHGPVLYLYTLYSLRKDSKIRKTDYLHFAPVLITYLYMADFFLFYSPNEKIAVHNGLDANYEIFKIVLLIAILISGLTYSILSYRLTWQHERKIGNNFSYSDDINLNWLRYCILSIGLIFFLAALVYLLREGMNISFSFNADYIFYTLIVLLIFYIGYYGVKHENIFTNNPQVINNNAQESLQTEKYKHSGLQEEVAGGLYKKLLKTMSNEKPYLEPKLTLANLAAQIDISPNQLSQIINQHAGVNFHDFVNKYRVEEFIHKAGENKNFSLLAIALDSGFNSKSSFNNVFKKHKGVTPSKYLVQKVEKHKKP